MLDLTSLTPPARSVPKVITVFAIGLAVGFLPGLVRRSSAAPTADSRAVFLPTWRLLSPDEKQQFISGYIQGWNDAGMVLDIAINYVGENPERAVNGLERIRELYDLRSLRPDTVVREVDAFYADPDNNDAALSKAVSAAKHRLN